MKAMKTMIALSLAATSLVSVSPLFAKGQQFTGWQKNRTVASASAQKKSDESAMQPNASTKLELAAQGKMKMMNGKCGCDSASGKDASAPKMHCH